MIEKDTIESIKQDVDLKDLIESKGISLKKNGKGYFGRCPFHHDNTPSLSVTPSKNQWHCFGCGPAVSAPAAAVLPPQGPDPRESMELSAFPTLKEENVTMIHATIKTATKAQRSRPVPL